MRRALPIGLAIALVVAIGWGWRQQQRADVLAQQLVEAEGALELARSLPERKQASVPSARPQEPRALTTPVKEKRPAVGKSKRVTKTDPTRKARNTEKRLDEVRALADQYASEEVAEEVATVLEDMILTMRDLRGRAQDGEISWDAAKQEVATVREEDLDYVAELIGEESTEKIREALFHKRGQ